MDLGAANIFIAMAIATTKATLVVLFFMHLYDEGGVNRLVFVVSLALSGGSHPRCVRRSDDPAAHLASQRGPPASDASGQPRELSRGALGPGPPRTLRTHIAPRKDRGGWVMRHARERWMVGLGLGLPVLLFIPSWATADPEEAKVGGEVRRESEGGGKADTKTEEVVPLVKRLERLRSARAEVESVVVEDPGSGIAPVEPVSRQEAVVPPRPPTLERPESLPELGVREKQRWFRTPEWRARFGELRRCPGEVAFRRSVRPRAVKAGRVVLRWIIDLEGRVRDAAVVAAAPVDPDVMSCVHRKMSEWQITPRPDTPYRANWTLRLR